MDDESNSPGDESPSTIDIEKARCLPWTRDEFDQLCKSANAGDEGAIRQLRSFFDESPAVWRRMSDLSLIMESKLITRIMGADLARQEALRRRVDEMKSQLLGSDPALVLTLAAAPVIASWLEVEDVLIRFGVSKAATNEAQRFAAEMIESAQRRHAAALKEFVRIQELLGRLPTGIPGQRPRPGRPRKVI